MKVLFIFVAVALLDKKGRRPLLLWGGAGIVVAHLMMAGNFLGGNNMVVALLGLSIFMASFSAGIGPTTWVLAAEIFPLAHRGLVLTPPTFFNSQYLYI